jgi:hypothetical protein
MEMSRCVRNLCGFALLFLGATGIARSQQAQPLPVWQPTEAQANEFGAEFKGKGWAIKPPKGFPNKVTDRPDQTTTTWAKSGGGIGGGIVVVAAHGQATRSLDAGVENLAKLLGSRYKNFKAAPTEHGQIDGKTFARSRFVFEGNPAVPGTSYGFVYLTYDGKTPYAVTGFGSAANIEMIEASALTFRLDAK